MRACIFDLDGTLLNTLADIGLACNFVLQKHGHSAHTIEEYKNMIGNGFHRLIQRAFAPSVLEEGKIDEFVAEARNWYADHMMENTAPYAGVPEMLDSLAGKGIFMGVLSNKPDAFTVELIEHFFADIPFAFVLGAREAYPLKPDPEVLLMELKRFSFKPSETFYVGDTGIDIHTAKNAGCVAVGVSWGFRGAEALRLEGADMIIEKPGELEQYFHKKGMGEA